MGADLLAHKRGLPVAITFGSSGADAAELGLLAAERELAGDDVTAITAVLDHAQASQSTRRYVDHQVACAMGALDKLTVAADVRGRWETLATFLASRTT